MENSSWWWTFSLIHAEIWSLIKTIGYIQIEICILLFLALSPNDIGPLHYKVLKLFDSECLLLFG